MLTVNGTDKDKIWRRRWDSTPELMFSSSSEREMGEIRLAVPWGSENPRLAETLSDDECELK